MSYKRLKPDVALFDTVESVVADFEDFPATEAEVPGVDIVQEVVVLYRLVL